MKINLCIPQVVCISMLLWALNPENEYAYYTLLRWICCGTFFYLAFQAYAQKKQIWVWLLGITALLYNPIFPLHLNRVLWSVVNVVTVAIAVVSIFAFKVKIDKTDTPSKIFSSMSRTIGVRDKTAILTILRWIIFLPVAVLGAFLAQMAVIAINQMAFTRHFDPDSFIGEAFIRTVSNAIFGAVLVWIAVRLAPSHRVVVAIAMAAAYILGSIVAILTGKGIDSAWDYWAVLVGSAAVILMCIDTVSEQKRSSSVGALLDP
jgi:hypothetical protein